MKAIFNSRIINTSKPSISTNNRSFCYGDGLFETIVTGSERIDLIKNHLNRLKRGCDVLGMGFPEKLSEKYLRECVESLKSENNLKGNIRTKLILWRNEGGLYSPEDKTASFYIECKQSQKPLIQGAETIGISEEVRNHFTQYAFAKRTSAIHYVLAGTEKDKKNWDDIILLDNSDNLSETGIANLFWVKDGEIFTPKLSTGCIEGIMRGTFLNIANQTNIKVNEVCAKPSELKSANSIFTTNASGITYYSQFHGAEKWYENPTQIIKPIVKLLRQP